MQPAKHLRFAPVAAGVNPAEATDNTACCLSDTDLQLAILPHTNTKAVLRKSISPGPDSSPVLQTS